MKRVIALLLIFILLLAGCGRNADVTTDTSQAATDNTEVIQDTGASEQVDTKQPEAEQTTAPGAGTDNEDADIEVKDVTGADSEDNSDATDASDDEGAFTGDRDLTDADIAVSDDFTVGDYRVSFRAQYADLNNMVICVTNGDMWFQQELEMYNPVEDLDGFEFRTYDELFGYPAIAVCDKQHYFPYIYYYVILYDRVIWVAENAGRSLDDAYLADLNGDGYNDLICNMMYGDGAEETFMFCRDGLGIYKAFATHMLNAEPAFSSVGSVGASYNPDTKKIEIWYASDENGNFDTEYHEAKFDDSEFTEENRFAVLIEDQIEQSLSSSMLPKDSKKSDDNVSKTKNNAKIKSVSVGKVNDPNAIEILMVGDVLLHPPVTESGHRSDGTYNYDHLFKEVEDDIDEAHIAIVNQEVILGGKELGLSGYPCFNGPYEVGDALVKAGFDVVLHATNHALDKGAKGINNCISFWRSNYPDIYMTGIYDSKEDFDDIPIIEVGDYIISILNYTYGTNGIKMPDSNPYAVRILSEKQVRKDVEMAKEISDFVIVCPHWGTEYTHKATSEQAKWTRLFDELNVDLVIGAHPHVIEPVEMFKDADGNEMLVYYSLGNFVNSTGESGKGIADRMLGAMAKVYLAPNADGELEIEGYEAVPIVTHLENGFGKLTTYKLEEYNEKLAKKNLIVKQDSSFSIDYIIDLWNEIIE